MTERDTERAAIEKPRDAFRNKIVRKYARSKQVISCYLVGRAMSTFSSTKTTA